MYSNLQDVTNFMVFLQWVFLQYMCHSSRPLILTIHVVVRSRDRHVETRDLQCDNAQYVTWCLPPTTIYGIPRWRLDSWISFCIDTDWLVMIVRIPCTINNSPQYILARSFKLPTRHVPFQRPPTSHYPRPVNEPHDTVTGHRMESNTLFVHSDLVWTLSQCLSF